VNDELIRTALREATDTADVVIAPGAIGQVPDVLRRTLGRGSRAVVVADATTWRVAGERVQAELAAAGVRTADPWRFPPGTFVAADYTNVELLRDALREVEAIPVAVGSGSLNDVVKRAAHELARPYVTVATAASMDGYTAFGAAITKEGYKRTMACPAPKALVADLDVLRGAPADMTASGYGDLLGKVTAGADWLVADALEVEALDRGVWDLVQGPLRTAVGSPAELAAGDPQAMDHLIEGLVMSGLAMQAAASSRPASGAEHQFSHLWEMEGLGHDRHPPLSHGFKVGVGSVAVAALYERVLARDLTALDADALAALWPDAAEAERRVRATHTTPGLDEAAVAETLAKHAGPDELRARLALLAERWPALRERLAGQLMPAATVRELLAAAGCPTGPAGIGLGWDALEATYQRARMIRRRYTVLDLANEAGILDECVDELFAPGGFWAARAA
jgi:glycerol-1-phosphate dehydrogenase [NAD(P)+]